MISSPFTPYNSPALYFKHDCYPPAWAGKVPLRVEVVKKVTCVQLPEKAKLPIALPGTIFDVWVDSDGLVIALFESGEALVLTLNQMRVVDWHSVSSVGAAVL